MTSAIEAAKAAEDVRMPWANGAPRAALIARRSEREEEAPRLKRRTA
ncbi:hypothetical protein [Tropicimonas sp. IMCC34011]|nr:hypothetical protein [Tropicimonas sp. IMCC34011]